MSDVGAANRGTLTIVLISDSDGEIAVIASYCDALEWPMPGLPLCFYSFSHVLVRLAQAADVGSVTLRRDDGDMQAFARKRGRFGELVDPLSTPRGTLYISVRTDQKQSRLSRMRSRYSVPVDFPVTPNIFPVRGRKVPGYVATGICPQAIDESSPFSEPNSRRDAESTRFPVIFPVHGNWRRHRSYHRQGRRVPRLRRCRFHDRRRSRRRRRHHRAVVARSSAHAPLGRITSLS
jgi:hypothetical protein